MATRKKIVLVGDDEADGKALGTFLNGHGYDVSLALSNQDGLQLVTDVNPDLIVLDFLSAETNVSEVSIPLRARKTSQHIPIVVCAPTDASSKKKAKGPDAGVDDCLRRPFEFSELLPRLKALLARPTYQFRPDILTGIDELIKVSKKPVLSARTPPSPSVGSAPLISVTVSPAPAHRLTSVSATTFDVPAATLLAPKIELEPFHPLVRVLSVLNHPSLALANARQNEDLLVSLMLVLSTPMIASVAQLGHAGNVEWLSALMVKIGVNLGAWFAIAGVLNIAVPFLGKSWSLRRALSIAGLAWAPRALEAAIAALYAYIAPLFIAHVSIFSGGFDIFPRLNSSALNPLLLKINVFTLWSVAVVLIAVWTQCETKKKWNSITVTIALMALLCETFAHV
jgi:DNA-binding response OmpR family regulator